MNGLKKLFVIIDFDGRGFEGAELHSAIVSRKSREIDIVIETPEIICPEHYLLFKEKIQNLDTTINFSIRPKNCNLSTEILNQYFELFINDDSFKGIDSFKPTIEMFDSKIKISLNSQTKVLMLEKNLETVKNLFESFGIHNQIMFEYKHDTGLITEFENSFKHNNEMAIVEQQKNVEAVKTSTDTKSSKRNVFKIRPNSYMNYNIKDIDHDIRNIVVEGKIFDVEIFQTKKGMNILTVKITDFSDSIILKAFESKYFTLEQMNELKKGICVRVWGDVSFDSFAREQVIIIKKFEKITEPEERIDGAVDKRVELHTHTKMSAMDGVCDASEIIMQAAKWGHKAVAITDHDSLQSFPDMQKAEANAKKISGQEDFKVIYGVELSMIEDKLDIVFNHNSDFSLHDATYVVFDFETTGLSAKYDKIIEFGAVKIKDGIISDRLQFFVKPDQPLSPFTTELTGITDEMVSKGYGYKEGVRKIKEFFADHVLVAHNAKFDFGFIDKAYQQLGYDKISNPVIDTMEWSRAFNKGQKRHNLGALAKALKIHYDTTVAHRADYDADVLAHAFMVMLKKAHDELGIIQASSLINKQDHDAIGTQRGQHVTLLAKNQSGLKDLFKIVSYANTEYLFRGSPKIPRSVLERYRDDILIGSSCVNGEVFEIALNKNDSDLERVIEFYDYIEVQPYMIYSHLWQRGDVENKNIVIKTIDNIIKTCDRREKIVVATGDVHYVAPRDKTYREVYINSMGIGGSLHPLFDRRGRIKQTPDMHFRTTGEMLDDFSFLGEDKAYEIVVRNSNKIAQMIIPVKPLKDKLYAPKMDGAEEKLIQMCWDNAKKIYGDQLPTQVEDRLKKELDAITAHGFSVVYYISHLLVKKSLEDGYLVGSRGSVGSSFAATTSEISEVNPLQPHYICKCKYSEWISDNSVASGYDLAPKECPRCGQMMIGDGHDIPFETFLGFKGDKVPDIDLNFSGEYQSVAHAYTKELFGEDNVFRAGTISTVAQKTAFGFVKGYYEKKSIENIRRAEMERLAIGCEGTKRTTGQHPGGIIVIPDYMDVYDFTPVNFPANDNTSEWKTTHFDFHSIHDNVLKLDILGHVDPTAIRMLQDLTGIDPKTIPTNDPKVMEMFTRCEAFGIKPEEINGETTGACGIPEFGTRFVREMLKVTKPQSFADLVVISGLSHGTDVYLGNAKDLIEKQGKKLSEVIGCRDDIMVYLMYAGVDENNAFKIMEFVRKGLPTKLPEQWAEYKEIMSKSNVPEWYMESCQKIKYMFPKAHATAYVMMAWRVAWFKTYYPKEYYATFFTLRCDAFDIATILKGKQAIQNRLNDIDARLNDRELARNVTNKEIGLLPVLEMSLEMIARGIKFKNIDILKSQASNFIVEDDGLIPPFASIDGLGGSAAQSVIDARTAGHFISLEDLRKRTKLNKTHIEILENLNVLDGMDESDQISLF